MSTETSEDSTLAKHRKYGRRDIAFEGSLVIAACAAYFFIPRSSINAATIPEIVLGFVVYPTLMLVVEPLRDPATSVLELVSRFALVLVSTAFVFATLYLGAGTAKNFTSPLDHLDALYFSVGILTTAGTGNLAPSSHISRELVLLQMIADIGLVTFLGAAVASRLRR